MRWAPKYRRSFVIKLGLEKHAKSLVDSFFAMLEWRIRASETEKLIASTSDLVDIYRAHAARRTEPKEQEVFLDFAPTIEKHVLETALPYIKPSSLPSPLKGAHAYWFKNLDTRRVGALGHDGCTLTSVSTRFQRVPGVTHEWITSVPRIGKPPAKGDEGHDDEDDDPEEAELADEVHTSGEMGMGVTTYKGWRTSFRKTTPEVAVLDDVMRTLGKKHKFFPRHRLPAANRCMQVRPSAKKAVRKLARARAERAALRA